MIPIGAIISLAGTAASGIMSAINNRRMERERNAEYAREQAHYQAKANEDPLARSEVQAAVNQYDRDAEKQIENARNVATITGATPEYGLAVQKGVAQGKANLLSGVTAGASERKDRYEELAEQSRQNQYKENMQARQERNATYGALAANAANAFGSIVDSYQAQVPKVENNTGNNTTNKSIFNRPQIPQGDKFVNGVNTSAIQRGLNNAVGNHTINKPYGTSPIDIAKTMSLSLKR